MTIVQTLINRGVEKPGNALELLVVSDSKEDVIGRLTEIQ